MRHLWIRLQKRLSPRQDHSISDPEPLQRLSESRRLLAPTARALRGMRPPRFVGLFEVFANFVPFQQVSLDSGAAIVGCIVERFGEAVAHDGHQFHAFPEARVVAEARVDVLKACGLSLRKAETIHRAMPIMACRAPKPWHIVGHCGEVPLRDEV